MVDKVRIGVNRGRWDRDVVDKVRIVVIRGRWDRDVVESGR